MTFLDCSWLGLGRSLGVEPVAGQKALDDLAAAYSSPGRYYHTLEHIYHVLSTIKTLQSQAKDLTALQLAAWFHDVVYDSQAQDNEEKSADYADRLLQSLEIPSDKIAATSHLIRNTKHHQAAPDDIEAFKISKMFNKLSTLSCRANCRSVSLAEYTERSPR